MEGNINHSENRLQCGPRSVQVHFRHTSVGPIRVDCHHHPGRGAPAVGRKGPLPIQSTGNRARPAQRIPTPHHTTGPPAHPDANPNLTFARPGTCLVTPQTAVPPETASSSTPGKSSLAPAELAPVALTSSRTSNIYPTVVDKQSRLRYPSGKGSAP